MGTCSIVRTIVALVPLWLATATAYGQAPAPIAGRAAQVSDADLKTLLVWNSPWEGRGTAPGRTYSYRTVFSVRRDAVVA
jgi:hypothetical protein